MLSSKIYLREESFKIPFEPSNSILTIMLRGETF